MMTPEQHKAALELERNSICMAIIDQAVNELHVHMRYLDAAVASLHWEQTGSTSAFGTDGFTCYYHPVHLMNQYKNGQTLITRGVLHMLLHCILGHPDHLGNRDVTLWDIACDMAVELILDELPLRVIRRPVSMVRRDWYHRLRLDHPVPTAEAIYRYLEEHPLEEKKKAELFALFFVDDHAFWYDKDHPRPQPKRQQKWDDLRDKIQTEMETFGNEASDDHRSLREQVRVENRDRYDYRVFLKKFSVLKEEIQVDMDSFDYIFYSYGLSLYGNMPLVEPNETREVQKIEDFVIVIDTSMSCKGELVLKFLEETYSILSTSESFFRKINVHLIQCDDEVREDVVITSYDEMQDYMKNFTLTGQGGTDFRPAFGYVNQLMAKKAFTNLRGLIYFTDGYGTFPMKRPPFETAFVFWEENYRELDVPPWAIKLVMTREDLMNA